MGKIKSSNGWRWILLFTGVLWLCTFANRVILSPLMGLFQDKWGLSGTEVGLLGSVIYLSYFIFQIPSGLLANLSIVFYFSNSEWFTCR